MKNIVVIFIVLSLASCIANKSIIGGYWSVHKAQGGGPVSIIYLEDDSTYIKVGSLAFGIYLEGKWSISGDTLFLEDILSIPSETL